METPAMVTFIPAEPCINIFHGEPAPPTGTTPLVPVGNRCTLKGMSETSDDSVKLTTWALNKTRIRLVFPRFALGEGPVAFIAVPDEDGDYVVEVTRISAAAGGRVEVEATFTHPPTP